MPVAVVPEGQLCEPLGADHVPDAVQFAGHRRHIDADRHRCRRMASSRPPCDRVRPVPDRELGPRDGADPIRVLDLVVDSRVGERACGYGRDVTAAMVEDLRVQPVVRSLDDVAGCSGHLAPGQPDMAGSSLGEEVWRLRQRGGRIRRRRVGESPIDAALPILTCVIVRRLDGGLIDHRSPGGA